MTETGPSLSYVLVTPARNEERSLDKTIQSVVLQTIQPTRWVIVDDGSLDRTADIVKGYLGSYPWIQLVQLPQHRDRSFAGKVSAFNAGYERVKNVDHQIIGNLDADVTFPPAYLEFLLGRFLADQGLGVAGTIFKEEGGYSSEIHSFEGHMHVAGGCQLFRRQCFEEIGGYVPNRAGGVDWIAVTTARMKGWKTQSFREMFFFHHRRLGTAERGVLRAMFSYGEKDYYLGGHPAWELCRVIYRASKPPYLVGGAAVGLGYGWGFLRRTKRPVSQELIRFHRQEQMSKLRAILKAVVMGRRVDSFRVELG